MKLGNQAMGALMMTLQKCLLEERDIVALLEQMEFSLENKSSETLIIVNPPVVDFAGTEFGATIKELLDEE